MVFLNLLVVGVTGDWQKGGIIWVEDPIGLSACVLMPRARLRSLPEPLRAMLDRGSADIVKNV
jgi:hypothetical protein